MFTLRTLGLSIAVLTGTVTDSERITFADEKKDKGPPTKSIPLSELYATFKQEGVTQVVPRPRREGSPSLRDRAADAGPSNVFLVRGSDIEAAVLSTESAFMGVGADRPLRGNPPTKDNPVWMVAHLGVRGSSPPAFAIKGVEVAGKRIRICYEEKRPGSADERAYLVWAPLGDLEPGEYTLQLYDVVRQRVVLMRQVEVDK